MKFQWTSIKVISIQNCSLPFRPVESDRPISSVKFPSFFVHFSSTVRTDVTIATLHWTLRYVRYVMTNVSQRYEKVSKRIRRCKQFYWLRRYMRPYLKEGVSKIFYFTYIGTENVSQWWFDVCVCECECKINFHHYEINLVCFCDIWNQCNKNSLLLMRFVCVNL